jgi:hypothetical protein
VRILRYLARRGVVHLSPEALEIDDELAARDPMLAQLAAAAVSGLPPAGPELRCRPPVRLARTDSSGPLRRALGNDRVEAGGIRRTNPPAVAVDLRHGEDKKTQLVFFRSSGAIPTTLRPPLPAFHAIEVPLAPGRSASLRAASLRDGSVCQDLEWSEGNGRAALRFAGRTVDLLRLARQMIEDTR